MALGVTPLCYLNLRPQIKRDYPLNLSILISGGRESNCDSLSSGERSGKSSDLKSGPGIRVRIVAFGCTIAVVLIRGESSLEWDAIEGESPVHHRSVAAPVIRAPTSRVVWDCSPKPMGR